MMTVACDQFEDVMGSGRGLPGSAARAAAEVELEAWLTLEMAVPAEVHSDDFDAQAQFDASPWFRAATDADLEELVRVDFANEYVCDELARSFESSDADVAQVFAHVDALAGTSSEVGFECAVQETGACAWIWSNRPELARKLDLERP